MKKIFFAIFFLFGLVSTALAQKDSLQFDEANKYVYYHVAENPGMSNDTLYNRASKFLKSINVKPMDKMGGNSITGNGKFVVYNSSFVSKKEAGEIAYQLNIETKEGKYRYKFSRFVFTPYKIDRYGSMVAVPGITVPAEKFSSKFSKKDTETYLDQAGAFCTSSAKQLGAFMAKVQQQKPAEAVKRVVTEKW